MKTTDSNYQTGLKFIEKKKYRLALQKFSLALDKEPGSVKILHKRGVSYKLLDDLENAGKDFTRALEIDPHHYPCLFELGCLYGKKKDYIASIAQFSKALITGPAISLIYACRGYSYGELKDFHEAISDYSIALKLYPDSIYEKDEEIQFLTKTTEKFNIKKVYYNRGINREVIEDFHGAIQDYSAAISYCNQEAMYYYRRGMCKQKLGDYHAGDQDINTAREVWYLNTSGKPYHKPDSG